MTLSLVDRVEAFLNRANSILLQPNADKTAICLFYRHADLKYYSQPSHPDDLFSFFDGREVKLLLHVAGKQVKVSSVDMITADSINLYKPEFVEQNNLDALKKTPADRIIYLVLACPTADKKLMTIPAIREVPGFKISGDRIKIEQ
jgi:hypothetical protein